VGRDDLALKRHRFFAELLDAAQAAIEQRAKFDPVASAAASDDVATIVTTNSNLIR